MAPGSPGRGAVTDIGIFSRPDPSTLTAPVAGLTWGFDQTNRMITVYDGTSFTPITARASVTTTAIGGQTNFFNHFYTATAAGTMQQAVFYARIDGVAAGCTSTSRLAAVYEATTGGGTGAGTGNPITAINANVYQQPTDTTAQIVGMEFQVCSNKTDATLDMTPPQVALSLVSGGGFIAEVAMSISGAAQWMEGIQIAQGGIAAGGFAFRYKGNGTSGTVSLSADSIFTLPLGGGSGQVSAGTTDSGGAGYRVLRVPN